MTLAQRAAQLRAQFESCVAHVLDCAASAGAPGSQWGEVLSAWTAARQVHLSAGGTAARPDALREVLLAVARAYGPHVEQLEGDLAAAGDGMDAIEDALWEFRHRRLAQLVDDELPKYIQRVAPAATMGSIFADAAARSQHNNAVAAAHKEPLVRTLQCKGCGAPRDRDNLYGTCPRCGTRLFEGADR